MEKVNINLSGISSSSVYTDGEMMSLVNLRKKTGALEPVPPRKVSKVLKEEADIVFIHNIPNVGEQWIYVTQNNIYQEKPPAEYDVHIQTIVGIQSISQIGNVLVFTTLSDKFYALYENTGYIFLGAMPELPGINLRTFPISNRYADLSSNRTNFVKDVKGKMYELMNATFETDGYSLHDAHFFLMAYKLYDGTYVKHSSPLIILPPFKIYDTKTVSYAIFQGESAITSLKVRLKTFGIAFENFDDAIVGLEQWKDVISSIDFFLSPNLGISNPEEMKYEGFYFPSTPSAIFTFEGPLVPTFTDSSKDNIRDLSQFHLIRSIPTEQSGYTPNFSTWQFPSGQGSVISNDKRDDDNIKNLTSKVEVRDLFSDASSWGAKQAYVYNGRLHLADLTRKVYDGHIPKNLALFSGEFIQDEYPFNGNYTKWEYNDYPTQVAIKVDVKLPTGLVSVWAYSDMDEGRLWLGSPYFSYPDSRAVSAIFYILRIGQHSHEKMREVSLKPHPFLNIAYFLEPSLLPIQTNEGLEFEGQFPENERPVFISEPNKMKVSELNNPFVFQDINSHTVGQGKIIGMMSNAMRVSEGQFGQFPLYVFTSESIYALNVGQDVLYTTKSPVSNEIPISKVLCSTPFGVVFIGKRGLYIINGQNVEPLTTQLEVYPTQISLDIPKVGVLPNRSDIKTWNDHFLEYLDGVTEIAFDNKESELILLNPSKADYNFVYNIPSKMWYQSTEIVDRFVQNAQPALYGLRGKDIVDFSRPSTTPVQIIEYTTATQETIIVADGSLVPVVINGEQLSWNDEPIGAFIVIIDDVVMMLAEGESVTVQPGQTIGRYTGLKEEPVKTAVSFVTRPLNFGLYDLKKLERVILRARLDAANDVLILTNNAIDDINFSLDKGMKLKYANYKDIYLGMMTKKYRQIVLMFAAKLKYSSRIYSIDAMVEKANEKMI